MKEYLIIGVTPMTAMCFAFAVAFISQSVNSIEIDRMAVTNADRETTPQKSQLNLSVGISESNLRLQGRTRITIKLRNAGQASLYVLKRMGWGAGSSFSYEIRDMDDKPVIGPLLSDAKDRPPFSKEDFVEIAGSRSIVLTRWLDVYSERISKPGRYVLTIFYHSPVTCEMAPSEMSVWTLEDGTLGSEVAFEVIE